MIQPNNVWYYQCSCYYQCYCICGLNLPHLPAVLLHVLRRPPTLPLSALLPILLLVTRHRVQLWPSQGALAGSHLTGPWPQDDSQHQQSPYMRDKATQTPRAWADERRRGSHKRSASCGSTDQLKEIAKLRQQLQRSKRSSRHRRDKERKSPFNGSHTIIQSQSPMPKTILIPIPISKSSAPRFRNSVEGLNQEIERIIIRDTPEKDETIVPQDVPDGHRAPPPVPPQRSSSTRSIDTQTPSGGGLSGNHSNCSSRPDSISPSYLTVLNDTGGGSPYEDKELGPCSPLPKYAASPRPNNSYMFKREPPEGCEKVKVSEETMPKPLQEIPPFLCPDRNKVNFIPNSGSAFCLTASLSPYSRPGPQLPLRGGPPKPVPVPRASVHPALPPGGARELLTAHEGFKSPQPPKASVVVKCVQKGAVLAGRALSGLQGLEQGEVGTPKYYTAEHDGR
ncbi:protein FAM117B-like [Epinephelus fuscoguttatus]|uniref:protein FAM117B-like n=1 Tax=Epinephelus fuscoguttatus TaxID=293821 RepID=UPI0020D05D8D|nr:protein FAM117B-like [Epinephelus fuscoguttatus]